MSNEISDWVVNKKALSLSIVLLSFLAFLACGLSKIEEPEISLLEAIEQGNVRAVRQHMSADTDPNQLSLGEGDVLTGAYPLHLAVMKNDEKLVGILLDNGAKIDLEASNKEGATPLHWATFSAKKDMVALLIELGATVNSLDSNNETPLDSAMRSLMVNATDAEKTKLLIEIMTVLQVNGAYSGGDL